MDVDLAGRVVVKALRDLAEEKLDDSDYDVFLDILVQLGTFGLDAAVKAALSKHFEVGEVVFEDHRGG